MRAKARPLVLSAAVLTMAIFAATGQSTSPKVTERQQDMKAMAGAAKTIDAMFKGSSPYNSKAFKAAAETIRTYSGEWLAALFEAPVVSGGSKASDSIEADRPTFDRLAAELGAYASVLSVAADRNPDALGPDMRMKGGDATMGGPLAKRKAGSSRSDVDTRRARLPHDAADVHLLPRQV